MKSIRVRELLFGEGIPKICVPFVGKTIKELEEEADLCSTSPADLAEWRADYFAPASSTDEILTALRRIRSRLQEKVLLFTFRTRKEGGSRETDPADYARLLRLAADSGLADMIDVEMSVGEPCCSDLIRDLHRKDVRVILSRHDFAKTPPAQEIESVLCSMHAAGADLPKIAVMPQSRLDVLSLMSGALAAAEKTQSPVIAMSMGKLGTISRITGETFGSAMTFGVLRESSAPGQIAVEELYTQLHSLHSYSAV